MARVDLDDNEHSGRNRPMTTDTNERDRADQAKPEKAPRRRGGLASLIVIGVIVAFLAFQVVNHFAGWFSLNPFAEKTKDRSGPVLLQSIRDLSRYEAASGNFQVIVDLEKDARFLPSAVRGKRTLFVGNGSVDAYVDFSKLASGAVTVNKERTVATIKLPRSELEPTNLNTSKSYVYATQRGLTNRFGDFFSGNPNDQQQLYVLAAQKIQTAAGESGLRERADRNTKLMLENMLKALGFKTVTVTIGSGT
ncbi:DUF4230 domain-containing protein [Actinomadura sp. HBU206391]|nr:DUF4230 domain-containing protein [Actinomadura sp. HBU206391]